MKSFNEFQKEYTGDGEKSCLSLTIPVDEPLSQYQIGMLEKNHIALLLPLVVQRVNDEWRLNYDITSKIPLSLLLERKSLQHHEFEFIIRQLAAMVHDLKEYLLDLPSAVLDKNYIYCDPADFTLYFIYLPMKTAEKEPERMKSFLRRLIIEDIRLAEDVSGALLKKLLEALKADTFSSELLYQCMSSSIMNTRQSTHAPAAAQEAAGKPPVNRGDNLHAQNIPAKEHVNLGNASHSSGTPSKGSSKSDIAKNTGLIRMLPKYPKTSWLIAGCVNLALLGILVYIIVTSGKNPQHAVSNIAGFLLIAAAGNYFLITRLYSKDKIISNSDTPKESTGKEAFKKRFTHENSDEDIILPKNPGIPVRSDHNRERIEVFDNTHSAQTSSAWAIPGSYRTEKGNMLENSRNAENGIGLNANTQQNFVQNNGISSSIASEMNQSNAQAVPLREDPPIPRSPAAEKINRSTSSGDMQIELLPGEAKSGFETTRPAASSSYQNVLHTSGIKMTTPQSFPDKTMILGRSAQQLPCLYSLSRPYEKILLDKASILIGRLPDSVDHVIQNCAIGKIHAEIKKIEERYFIIDLNSVNGTYVNGERLVCNTQTLMNNGDKVTLANESYTFTA